RIPRLWRDPLPQKDGTVSCDLSPRDLGFIRHGVASIWSWFDRCGFETNRMHELLSKPLQRHIFADGRTLCNQESETFLYSYSCFVSYLKRLAHKCLFLDNLTRLA